MTMSENEPIKMLDVDTSIIKQQGWMLNKIFEDEVNNSLETYQKAIIYVKRLAVQFNVAIRSVTNNDSHFMEVYRK